MDTKNIIIEKALSFSIEVIEFCEKLESQKKYVIANQLLRCGTSIGACVFEAQHAESKADFIHKMKLAAKEASETSYWLLICEKSKNYPENENLKVRIDEIIRILSKIIVSSRNRNN